MAISAESLILTPAEVKTHVNDIQGAAVHGKGTTKISNGNNDRPEPTGESFSTPYDVLTAALPLPAPTSSTGYWWRKTGPLMSSLLEKANYPLYKHYKYLLLYHTHILPLLGPRPIENSAQSSDNLQF